MAKPKVGCCRSRTVEVEQHCSPDERPGQAAAYGLVGAGDEPAEAAVVLT